MQAAGFQCMNFSELFLTGSCDRIAKTTSVFVQLSTEWQAGRQAYFMECFLQIASHAAKETL